MEKKCKLSDCNEFIRHVTTVSLYQAWLPISHDVTYAERCEISLRELILISLTLVREGSEPGAWNAKPHLQQITDLMALTNKVHFQTYLEMSTHFPPHMPIRRNSVL